MAGKKNCEPKAAKPAEKPKPSAKPKAGKKK